MSQSAANVRAVLPLRILLAPSAYHPHVGGIEELTKRHALMLMAHGYDVSVLTNRWPEGVRRTEVLDGVCVTRLRFPLPAAHPTNALRFLVHAPSAATQLVRHLRGVRPHVVHVIGAGPQSAYLASLARPLGSALVFTAQGELMFDAGNIFARSESLRAGLRRMLRTADAVTACSAYVLRDLQAFGSVRAGVQVVPNAVDPDEFSDSTAEKGLGSYVLAVGRLVPQKGFDVLLNAFAEPRLSELQLVLAGTGPERERLARQADGLGLTRRVHFVGAANRNHLGRLLRGATAFALPSRGEPFGIALLEAMAAGVPAVATAAGGVPEFATDGYNALLVDADQPEPFANALSRLCTDEPLRMQLIRAGKRTADELSWATISKKYEETYAAALEMRRS